MHEGETPVAQALRMIERDADLDAWAFVATSAPDAPALDGPLSGIPFGVKDIIDVARMPTGFGLHRELRKARFDAWCVALVRAAGAVPIGKTRTTAHAYRDPAPTLNPLDAARTPGGSSAGSAVAVAARHVPFALGTQTIGSILRPAAYCGVVGFKPSWGRIPMQGVAPLAPSLDHVGVIGHDVAMVKQVAHVLMPTLREHTLGPLRLAVATSIDDGRSSAVTRAAVERALGKVAAAQIAVVRERLPFAVSAAPVDADLVMAYEAHATLAPLLAYTLPAELRLLLERGKTILRTSYLATLEAREASFSAVNEAVAAYDAIIVPGADAAPLRDETGDGSAYAPWSFFGMPAITVPIPGTAPAALGLQIVAARGEDARLLAVALAVEAAFGDDLAAPAADARIDLKALRQD